jgi:hypothetical protein
VIKKNVDYFFLFCMLSPFYVVMLLVASQYNSCLPVASGLATVSRLVVYNVTIEGYLDNVISICCN